MTHDPTTARIRAWRASQPLLAAAVLTTIIAILACSSDHTQPTSRPLKQDDSPEQTIEAMAIQISALQTKSVGADKERQTAQLQTVGQPIPTHLPGTPAATNPPDQLAIAAPSGTGICSRSPAVQQAILLTLRTSSCRLITTEELYRITHFLNLRGDKTSPDLGELKAGDLHGLVNLETLEISGDYILPRETFAGTEIKNLSLSGVKVTPGTFDGMASMETLRIHAMGEFPNLDAKIIEKISSFRIHFDEPIPDMSGSEFVNMKGLENIQITGDLYGGMSRSEIKESGPGREYRIPTDLFRENSQLENVRIAIDLDNSDDWKNKVLFPRELLN